MSLWQGPRWTHRSNQSVSGLHGQRPSLSGNSSAGASTVSLVSSASGNAPRRPLNALGIRQERRSSSIPPARPIESAKSDHDPVKTLIGILGEAPISEVRPLKHKA
jgi:hypothetical protein